MHYHMLSRSKRRASHSLRSTHCAHWTKPIASCGPAVRPPPQAANQSAVTTDGRRGEARAVAALKMTWLKEYCRSECGRKVQEDAAFKEFCNRHRSWLDPYAVFRVLYGRHSGLNWAFWPAEDGGGSDSTTPPDVDALLQRLESTGAGAELNFRTLLLPLRASSVGSNGSFFLLYLRLMMTHRENRKLRVDRSYAAVPVRAAAACGEDACAVEGRVSEGRRTVSRQRQQRRCLVSVFSHQCIRIISVFLRSSVEIWEAVTHQRRLMCRQHRRLFDTSESAGAVRRFRPPSVQFSDVGDEVF